MHKVEIPSPTLPLTSSVRQAEIVRDKRELKEYMEGKTDVAPRALKWQRASKKLHVISKTAPLQALQLSTAK